MKCDQAGENKLKEFIIICNTAVGEIIHRRQATALRTYNAKSGTEIVLSLPEQLHQATCLLSNRSGLYSAALGKCAFTGASTALNYVSRAPGRHFPSTTPRVWQAAPSCRCRWLFRERWGGRAAAPPGSAGTAAPRGLTHRGGPAGPRGGGRALTAPGRGEASAYPQARPRRRRRARAPAGDAALPARPRRRPRPPPPRTPRPHPRTRHRPHVRRQVRGGAPAPPPSPPRAWRGPAAALDRRWGRGRTAAPRPPVPREASGGQGGEGACLFKKRPGCCGRRSARGVKPRPAQPAPPLPPPVAPAWRALAQWPRWLTWVPGPAATRRRRRRGAGGVSRARSPACSTRPLAPRCRGWRCLSPAAGRSRLLPRQDGARAGAEEEAAAAGAGTAAAATFAH
ncbi:uncharacterized protein LOC143694390 [Agelaius phoeniceus]|uniref:uncharacterized protein LOC143694390 n=1 Tax=Agelaius phoeniceus TaxID=39638 RepID=UPI0040550F9B